MTAALVVLQLAFQDGEFTVVLKRFEEAREQKRPDDELLRHMNETISFQHPALEHFPADAVGALAVTHNALGSIYGSVSA